MSTLETGPFCAECQIHRVQAPGTKCPVCLDDEKRRAA